LKQQTHLAIKVYISSDRGFVPCETEEGKRNWNWDTASHEGQIECEFPSIVAL
jgi:hypothetical protein